MLPEPQAVLQALLFPCRVEEYVDYPERKHAGNGCTASTHRLLPLGHHQSEI
jgi:hypothetical protein